MPHEIIHQTVLEGGLAWSRRMAAHQVLRIVDPAGRACVSALFFNARDPLERYNMPDTLKAQHTAFLTAGRVLYSDMGRVLVSIVDDSAGWHDTITGCGDAPTTRARFGEGRYQERRNRFYRNARDNFLVELGKHGLGRRDLSANVNFFVRVTVSEEGRTRFSPGSSRPGAHVDLRFEMDVLVILSNTPHALDPETQYEPPPVELLIWRGQPAGPGDVCRTSRPENERGFELTRRYLEEVRE